MSTARVTAKKLLKSEGEAFDFSFVRDTIFCNGQELRTNDDVCRYLAGDFDKRELGETVNENDFRGAPLRCSHLELGQAVVDLWIEKIRDGTYDFFATRPRFDSDSDGDIELDSSEETPEERASRLAKEARWKAEGDAALAEWVEHYRSLLSAED
jgi:hypothetical protein